MCDLFSEEHLYVTLFLRLEVIINGKIKSFIGKFQAAC